MLLFQCCVRVLSYNCGMSDLIFMLWFKAPVWLPNFGWKLCRFIARPGKTMKPWNTTASHAAKQTELSAHSPRYERYKSNYENKTNFNLLLQNHNSIHFVPLIIISTQIDCNHVMVTDNTLIRFASLLYLVRTVHDDVIKWKHFPHYWPFLRGIHRSPVNSLTKASDAELWCFLWSAPY